MLPSDKEPKFAEIVAAQKIIADISSGLYRSPAAALKELVSNAYDADATEIRIDTDVPDFRTLVVSDNGFGMSIDKFLEVMNHIGGSRKRIEGNGVTKKGRKVIGRIGIGLLAIAQLGYRFYVTSSTINSPNRFIAEVDLNPFHRDDAALISMGKMSDEKDEVTIGAIRYVDNIPEDPDIQYTAVTVPNMKQGLLSEITTTVREAVSAEEELSIRKGVFKDFNEIIEFTRRARRIDIQFDGYYNMLWELAQLCPINYSKFGPIERMSRNIEGYNSIKLPKVEDFRLYVDGVELLRPQLFPSAAALSYLSFDPKVYPLSFDKEVSSRRLKFVGYIYAQKPRIDPEEFRGVHIRIKHVGIGKYDRTWLGYPFDEGIKFGQITGEVFIDDGLEDALNIDRDSFRETDVHYQALRGYIWNKLRSEVFPDFKRRQKEFSEERKSQDRSFQAHIETLETTYSRLSIPIHSIYIIDKEGEIRWSKPDIAWTDGGDSFHLSSFIQTINLKEASVSGLTTAPVLDVPVVFIGSPTGIGKQGNSGVLLVAIEPVKSSIGGFVYPVRLGETGYIEIIDQNGIVVVRTEPGPELSPFEKSDHSGRFADLIRAGKPTQGVCHTCHEPEQKVERKDVLAFIPLAKADWGVVIRQSEDEALAPTRELRQNLILFGIVLVTVALLFVVITTRDVGSRIRVLTAASKKIAEGDLESRVVNLGRDEVGVLSQTLDDMRRKLKTSYGELKQKNAGAVFTAFCF